MILNGSILCEWAFFRVGNNFTEVKNLPSTKVLEAKKKQVEELKERLSGSIAGVIVDYSGISVEDDTKLRRELREAGVEYTVIKNSIVERAVDGTSYDALKDDLKGSTALATSKDDYAAAARILNKYADKVKTMSLKNGFIDEEVIGKEKLVELAKLPSREVLLSMVVGVLQAPISAFARAVKAVAESKDEAPAEEVKEEPKTEETAVDAEASAADEKPAE